VPRFDWNFDWYYYRPTPRGPIQLLEPTGNVYLAPTGESVRVCWTVEVPDPEPEEQKSQAKRERRLAQGHDYRQLTKVCRRPLSAAERRDLVSRFTVPSALWFGAKGVEKPGTYAVTWYGVPGGFVTTSYTPDGFTGTNVTTWAHVFQGNVDRSALNIDGAGYMSTHGYRTAPIFEPPMTSYSMFPSMPVEGIIDSYNQTKAPEIFASYDQRALEYAQENFDGC
jgi:hypothetical protein